MEVRDESFFTEHNDEIRRARAAKVARHVARLTLAVETLQDAIDGADLVELTEWNPMAAAECRPVWEAIGKLAAEQLEVTRVGEATSPRRPLAIAPSRKG